MNIGTIQTMQVIEVNKSEYLLEKSSFKKILPVTEATKQLCAGEYVDVFILKDKATMHLPSLTVNLFGWVTVCKKENELIYVDIGTTEPVVVAHSDLPAFKSVWPNVGDRLYVTLKRNRHDNLFVVPAKERQFAHLITFAHNVDLNDRITGTVIRTAREGTVILSDEGYRCFIHRTERGDEPRLGEIVTGRVIEVKEDGTLNVSLKQLKHERIDDDAITILRYLEANGGEMNFGDQSEPTQIRKTFNMSKSAFKRALGRLMRERKIEQRNEKTYLL